MLQEPSAINRANVVQADQKITAATTDSCIENPRSSDIADPEQQISDPSNDRLNATVIQLSSRRTLVQSLLLFSGCAVQLINGIKYFNQCPIQPLINIFLIVHGCWMLAIGIVLVLEHIVAKRIKRSSHPLPNARRLFRVNLIGQLVLLLFLVAWLVAGQVLVFGALTNGFQSSNANETTTYCHPNVFWTGFGIIIVYVVCLIVMLVLLIIILVIVGRFAFKRYQIKQK